MKSLFTHLLSMLVGTLILISFNVSAHGLEPIFISVVTNNDNNYRIELRLPDEFKEENSPYFAFPDDCQLTQFNNYISSVKCDESLIGKRLDIKFDYFVPQTSTLINYYDINGNNNLYDVTAKPYWDVPENIVQELQYSKFLLVGFEHILGGFDHVLFIICLLMVVNSKSQLIKAITGFTLAHSLTLVLVSVGVFQPAIEPIELIVALSVLLLAYEVATNSNSLTHRYPIVVSLICGLLHGIGFSSVLSEVNTFGALNLSSILFFNIGIELGQLLIVAAWLIVIKIGQLLSFDQAEVYKAKLTCIYLTGGLSLFWVLDRLFIWLESRAVVLFF
ncbi:HupE/UreJ family protein [Vibrio agarivorans]|uniref:HupE/UreJ family protein n=1 Tax=Vibrio agarivorans TaxID=153622 RepID=UPI00223251FA|nr:HupE/UreJ family protein [Vibrio agarivorans]